MKSDHVRKNTVTNGLVVLLFCLLFLSCLQSLVFADDYNGDVIVYYAENSYVYHREGCTYFNNSNAVYYTSLEDARLNMGLDPCSRCHPAILGVPQPTDSDPYIRPEDYTPSYSNDDEDDYVPEDDYYEEEVEEKESNPYTFPLILTGIAVIGGGSFINGRVQASKRRKKREEDREAFIKGLKGRTIREAAGVPANVYFFEGMPKDNNNRKYGSYTRYLSKSGNCYHEKQGCSSARYPAHAFKVAYQYKPCSKCHSSRIVIPEWYTRYEHLEKEASRLNIDKDINKVEASKRQQIVGQLNVAQKKPETKLVSQVILEPEKPETKQTTQARPKFEKPVTKPAPRVQQAPKELPIKPDASNELPERKANLRMVSFDINSRGKVEGKLDGKLVTFNSVWGQHHFTEEEIVKLLNDQSITFKYTTKTGKSRTATGKLGYGTGKYSTYFGFVPEDY